MAIGLDQLTGILNSTGQNYIDALIIFLALLIGLKLFGVYVLHVLNKLAKKTKTNWDDMGIGFVKRIKWPFYLYISFYAATRVLTLPEFADKVLGYLLVIFIGYYVIVGLNRAIDRAANAEIEKRKKKGSDGYSMIKVLASIGKIAVWIIALLMILSNLGIQITPLVASLGIGGIAIALALQTVLSDLFSAFAIYFDKPFKEGDFIIIGNDMGTVKQIGIKTTRIQSLQGQELIVSNSELTSSRINNYKQMKKRRISFGFGVEYGTSTAKLKKIVGIIGNIFKKVKNADLDRVHFKKFGDFSLDYEVVYYVLTNDYAKYMDIQQEINLEIKEAFEKAKINMAFPTQTLHIKKD